MFQDHYFGCILLIFFQDISSVMIGVSPIGQVLAPVAHKDIKFKTIRWNVYHFFVLDLWLDQIMIYQLPTDLLFIQLLNEIPPINWQMISLQNHIMIKFLIATFITGQSICLQITYSIAELNTNLLKITDQSTTFSSVAKLITHFFTILNMINQFLWVSRMLRLPRPSHENKSTSLKSSLS